MISPISVDVKLGVNKFNIDEEHPHITVKANADKQALELLVKAHSAGSYKKQDNGSVCLNYAGCLECGTCHILGLGSVLEQWEYLRGAFGMEFRYGWRWFGTWCRTDSHCRKAGITHATVQKL